MDGGTRPKHQEETKENDVPSVSVEKNKGLIANDVETFNHAETINIHIQKPLVSENPCQSQPEDGINKALKVLQSKARREFAATGSYTRHQHLLPTEKCFYVPLPLFEQKLDSLTSSEIPMKYENIFEPSRSKDRAPKSILILGQSGFGKSTIANKIVRDWATLEQSPASKFEMVMLFRLRDLRKGEILQEVLLKQLKNSFKEDVNLNTNFESVLFNLREKLLIILDGYDELSLENRSTLMHLLSKRSIFHSSTVLVTSRPDNIDSAFLTLFQRHLKISSLCKEDRKQFIYTYFGSNQDKAQTARLFLRNHKLAFLAEISILHLYAVCYLIEENRFEIVKRDSDLIFEVTRVMIIRAYEKENECRQLDESKIHSLVYRLGKWFLEKLKIFDYFFENKELVSICGSFKDTVLKFGLFQRAWRGPNEGWEVIHKSFMDCLSVYYLNEKLKKITNVDGVAALIRRSLGELTCVKTIIFKKGLGILALNGNPKEIVYVAYGGNSIFNGDFETIVNLKVAFDDYICLFKDPSVPNLTIYGENSSFLTIHETFGESSKGNDKQISIRFWPTQRLEEKSLSPSVSSHFKMVGYVRMIYSLENSKWGPKVFNHPQCDKSCKNLSELPEHIFSVNFFILNKLKGKNWNLVINDKSRCYSIA